MSFITMLRAEAEESLKGSQTLSLEESLLGTLFLKIKLRASDSTLLKQIREINSLHITWNYYFLALTLQRTSRECASIVVSSESAYKVVYLGFV